MKTHDFLQPLERAIRTNITKEAAIENPRHSSVEHVLPVGIGTYTISYSQESPTRSDQGPLLLTPQTINSTSRKKEGRSNGVLSYPPNTFTIWDESASARNKGKTGKENVATTERPIPREGSSKYNGRHNPMKTLGTFSDFHPALSSSSQKNHSFMDMITSAKNDQEDDDYDDDEDEFIVKKERTPSQSEGNVSVRSVEVKKADHQKPNTPRSKHSATEQRRRSKINDRFHKLREIIPNSDQKRDKASFLQEVIEYVQLLQGKASRYEDYSYNVGNHETSKMIQMRNYSYNDEGGDHTRGINAVSSSVHPTQFEGKKTVVSPPSIPINGQTNSLWDKGKQLQELTIESGRINISSVYSQGLLNTLTKALQSSGVDLSQATISVRIDIGKKYNSKDSDVSTSAGEDFGQALKRLKTS